MKITLLTSILITFGICFLQAQTNTTIYALDADRPLPRCDATGDLASPAENNDLINGWEFRENMRITGYHVIYFLPFHTPGRPNSLLGDDAGSANNRRFVYTLTDALGGGEPTGANNLGEVEKVYYLMPDAVFSQCATVRSTPRHSFTVNVVSLPFKIRFGKKFIDGTYSRYSELTSDVNLGANIGYKLRMTRKDVAFFNLVGGFTVGGIAIDPSTTKNTSGESKQAFGMSIFGGTVFEAYRMQIGCFLGWDYIPGYIGTNWSYRNSPWLGIGIGYNFLAPSNPPAAKQP